MYKITKKNYYKHRDVLLQIYNNDGDCFADDNAIPCENCLFENTDNDCFDEEDMKKIIAVAIVDYEPTGTIIDEGNHK